MARKSTIRLLVINASDNDAEGFVSAFRNAGRVARASRIDSAEMLLDSLQNDPIDLILATDQHPEISIEQCLEQAAKQACDAPVIAITDDAEVADQAFKAGASDVIAHNQENRLIHAANRELSRLEQQRQLQQLNQQLQEAEQRNALLLAKSEQAIAYVADGMLISANQLFCERFGFNDSDELDCLPVVDLIAGDDHEKFKGLLKTQAGLDADNHTELQINCQTSQGENFSVGMQLSNAKLDGESCIQISLQEPGEAAAGESRNGGDNGELFQARLDTQLKQAAAGTASSSLLLIAIDNFIALRKKVGLHQSAETVNAINSAIQQHCGDGSLAQRYRDDVIALLLPNSNQDQAKATAAELLRLVSEQDMPVDGLHCTASIGICVLDKEIEDSPAQLLDQLFKLTDSLKNGDGVGDRFECYVPARLRHSPSSASDAEELDRILEDAIEDECFELQFTPIVSLKGAAGDHYEVSTLYRNEQDEYIDAIDFLDDMNLSQGNTRVDRWILLEATKQLAANRETGHDTRVLINLSRQSILDQSLLPWLNVALKAGNLPAESLVFLYSSQQLNDVGKDVERFCAELQKIGCKIALKAINTAHAGLLQSVQADFVIVDRELTDGLQAGENSDTVKEIISTAADNNSRSIISNVENAAAMAMIWQSGVDYIQGNYLAAPSTSMDYEFTDIA